MNLYEITCLSTKRVKRYALDLAKADAIYQDIARNGKPYNITRCDIAPNGTMHNNFKWSA